MFLKVFPILTNFWENSDKLLDGRSEGLFQIPVEAWKREVYFRSYTKLNCLWKQFKPKRLEWNEHRCRQDCSGVVVYTGLHNERNECWILRYWKMDNRNLSHTPKLARLPFAEITVMHHHFKSFWYPDSTENSRSLTWHLLNCSLKASCRWKANIIIPKYQTTVFIYLKLSWKQWR